MRFKNSSGFGLIQIFIVVAGLVIFGFGGYMFYQSTFNKSDSSLSNEQKTIVQSACKLEGENKKLCAAMASIEPFSSESVTYTLHSSVAGSSSTMTVISKGDNYHMVRKDGAGTNESMRVNNINYHTHDGVWYFQQGASTKEHRKHHTNFASSDYMGDFVVMLKENKIEFKKLEPESCGDTVCDKYEVRGMSEPHKTVYLWIDPAINKLMKYESSSPSEKVDIVYSYEEVEINAPAGAKDFSELSK